MPEAGQLEPSAPTAPCSEVGPLRIRNSQCLLGRPALRDDRRYGVQQAEERARMGQYHCKPLYVGRDASAEFFKGGGTALSPGLIMMAMQAICTILSTRSGRAGKAGSAGLTLLGAGGTIGVLGETITYRVLSPKTFDHPKAAIVLAAIILAPLMTILSWRRLRVLRSSR